MPVQTTYPGVYLEERPSGVHTIVGVSTSVTAFVGAARSGPTNTPVQISSVAEYQRNFGLPWDAAHPMGHAIAHFFANGGSRAIVVRAKAPSAAPAKATLHNAAPVNVLVLLARGEGVWSNRTGALGMDAAVDYKTANPQDLFNLVLSLRAIDPRTGAAVLAAQETFANLSMSPSHPRYAVPVLATSKLATPDPAFINPVSADHGTSTGSAALVANVGLSNANHTLRVSVDGSPPTDVVLFPAETGTAAVVNKAPGDLATEIQNVLVAAGLNVTAAINAANRVAITSGTPGASSSVVVTPAPVGDGSRTLGLGVAFGGAEVSGAASLRPVETGSAPIGFGGGVEGGTDAATSNGMVTGAEVVPVSQTNGVYALGSLRFPRFNLLCLPDLPADATAAGSNNQFLTNALSYCRQEHAFLLVDTPPGLAGDPPLGGLPALGEHGAIYYPRLVVVEPGPGGSTRRLDLPTCGAVAGVIARIDVARGVWKAPAGLEAGVVGATDLTVSTDDVVSGRLNPIGVNVLRSFPAAGMVIWGARTLRGDDAATSEFKYLPVRRTTDFIKSSLYLGTQFAVFEPNDPELWGQLRLAVGTFMRGLFRQGAFQRSEKGAESDSFFVVCDETVNPQSEINLGRVNVVVGFAPMKPAEFVIITITQISKLED